MTTKYNNLLNNIKKIAHNKGMTLAKINKRAGLGKAYIYTWREHNPSVASIMKVAKILKVSIYNLIDKNEIKSATDNHDSKKMLLFNNIKKIANYRGISLNKLSKLCGLSINSIYQWQRCNPSFTNLQKVAAALEVPISDIIEIDYFNNRKLKIDLNDYHLKFYYRGKPIPDEFLKLIRQLLNLCLYHEK